MLICVVTVIWAQEEAKDAFKELLVAVQVASDWSWDKTMRSIISDPRYASPESKSKGSRDADAGLSCSVTSTEQ